MFWPRHDRQPSAMRRVRVPSIEHQLVHLIGHSQIRHFGHAFGRVSLRHRLEAAALVQWGRERIDWQAVSGRFVAAGYRRPLLVFPADAERWRVVRAPGDATGLTC